MTYDEFQDNIAKAGLTGQEFADLMGMNPRSVYNFGKSGRVPRYVAVAATLMRALHECGMDFRDTLSKLDNANRQQ